MNYDSEGQRGLSMATAAGQMPERPEPDWQALADRLSGGRSGQGRTFRRGDVVTAVDLRPGGWSRG